MPIVIILSYFFSLIITIQCTFLGNKWVRVPVYTIILSLFLYAISVQLIALSLGVEHALYRKGYFLDDLLSAAIIPMLLTPIALYISLRLPK